MHILNGNLLFGGVKNTDRPLQVFAEIEVEIVPDLTAILDEELEVELEKEFEVRVY